LYQDAILISSHASRFTQPSNDRYSVEYSARAATFARHITATDARCSLAASIRHGAVRDHVTKPVFTVSTLERGLRECQFFALNGAYGGIELVRVTPTDIRKLRA
jgi:hypothetical protein